MDDQLNQAADDLVTLTPDQMIKLEHRIARFQCAADALCVLARRPYFSTEQAAMILAHFGDAGKHADRTRDRSQRIADFVRDSRGQAADSGQAVLHAYFTLQAPNFGEIVEHVDVSQFPALGHGE